MAMTARNSLMLEVLKDPVAVCRLPPEAPFPAWAQGASFLSFTKTTDELSIVCPFSAVPPDVAKEGPWSVLKVQGPLHFSLTGILAALAVPLAEAKISIFALSTYDTDYLLVKAEVLSAAKTTLANAGHRFCESFKDR